MVTDEKESVGRDILCHGFHLALIGLQADSESHWETYCRANWIFSDWHLPLSHTSSFSPLCGYGPTMGRMYHTGVYPSDS